MPASSRYDIAMDDPEKPASALSATELYDLMCDRVGHDPQRPRWTPELVSPHNRSLERKLVVIPEHFYTPVYAPQSLNERVWVGRFDADVTYDADAQIALLEKDYRVRPEHLAFDLNADSDEAELKRYYWRNPEFSHGDAALYYSLLRYLRPRRVVEVGGGFSTLLSSHAAEKNGNTEVTCIEPFPRPFLARGLPRVRLDKRLAQDVEIDVFTELGAGDVLFIDSSHVVKTGSDVVHLFLRVLPLLRAGVWVHVHDVFLPFEFPRGWAEQRLYWNEQYLLAALLASSAKWEIRVANYFLERTAGTRLQRFAMSELQLGGGGASFWMQAIR